jgi:hypothetical protein
MAYSKLKLRAGGVLGVDPETTPRPTAGPNGMTMRAVGAPRGSYKARGPF